MSDNQPKKPSDLQRRRGLIQAIAGIGATILAYQHCAPAKFVSRKKDRPDDPKPFCEENPLDPSCQPVVDNVDCRPEDFPFDYPYYDLFGEINGHEVLTQQNPGSQSAVAGEHRLNVGYWHVDHYDQRNQRTDNRKYLLTVDVGASPNAGNFHPIPSFGEDNAISDIYIFADERQTASNGAITGSLRLLHWKRVGAADFRPSALFVLDQAVVTARSKLVIAARCTMHGFWAQEFNLASQNSASYAQAVPAANTAVKFASTNHFRPYVAGAADGGQNLSGAQQVLHTPTIQVVNNDQVQVFLGSSNIRHGAEGDNSYVTGALLFDQDGNRLAEHQFLNLSRATNTHVFTFNGLQLSQRGVRRIVAICQDTLNGHMMGFY